MAFDFPASPTEGQFYAPSGGPQYVYTSGAWRMLGAENVSISNIVTTVITSSGSYTKPAGLKFLEVAVVGGGGGGGNAPTTAAGQGSGAAGGGGGGTVIKLYKASDLAASTAYTIGTGGASAGGNGSASSFGALTAGGGSGGTTVAASTTYTATLAAVGGTATGGDINISGGEGGQGQRCVHGVPGTGVGGGGGGGYFVPSGSSYTTVGNRLGSPGDTPGGGGQGSGCGPSQASVAGGTGGAGRIYLKEYF